MTASNTTTMVTMEDGVRLNVKVLGDDAGHTKPLLITHHGAPGTSSLFEPEVAYAFLSKWFRVVLFDARGSGASDHVGPYTHDQWIKDIEALRRWAGAEKMFLAGGSYGGFISVDYAVRHSDKLLGLVLVGTFANGKLGAMTSLANCLISKVIKADPARQLRCWSGTLRDSQDLADVIEELGPIYFPPDEDSGKKAEEQPKKLDVIGEIPNFNYAAHNAGFSMEMPRFDVRDQLKNIRAPTLVVVGRYDVICPLEFNVEIASGVPNAKLEIFERSGHIPAVDEPEKFQKIVGDFLKPLI